jgi:CrcB protein
MTRIRPATQLRRHALTHADVVLAVSLGGAVGALARWGVGAALPRAPHGFPWATLIVNVTGCLALGALMVLLLEAWPASRYARPFLGVGLLGGYTTFSTYALEARDLLAGGRSAIAVAYLAVSVAAGLAAVWLGIVAARAAVLMATAVRRRRARQLSERATTRRPR